MAQVLNDFDSVFGKGRGLSDDEQAQADFGRMSAEEKDAKRQQADYQRSLEIGWAQDRAFIAEGKARRERVHAVVFALFEEQEVWAYAELQDAIKSRIPKRDHTALRVSMFIEMCKEMFDCQDFQRITLRPKEKWGC